MSQGAITQGRSGMSDLKSAVLDSQRVLTRRRPPAPLPHRAPLGRLRLLMALRDNPLTIWTERHFREPILQGEGLLGFGTIISEPTAIRHVLVENAANYRKDDLQLRVLSPGLGKGLLTAEGDTWKQMRRTLAPLFTPRQVDAFAAPMAQAISARVEGLRRRAGGHPIAAEQEMIGLTFDVLARTLFSDAIPAGPRRFARAIDLYFDTLGRLDPLDLLGAPSWLPRLGRWRVRPALDFFADQVRDIVERRRKLMADAPDQVPADLLTALLRAQDPETGMGLTDEEVGANIITFIAAGHETTANTLVWALFLVARDRRVRARLEAEADAVLDASPAEAVSKLVYTRAVIEEAMRLYPPVASMTRTALAEDRVGDMVIPQGSLIIVSPWVLHRHRKLWPEPDLFRPERFLPGAREALDRYQFLPFGTGPRVCIGAQFAMQEAVLALAMMARGLTWRLDPSHPVEPVQRVTLRPRHGLPLVFTPRG
jgi:cytochrome P450